MSEKNKSILLVEDNPDDTELTLMALKKNNITNNIVHVWDGSEALEYLFGKDGNTPVEQKPVLILLDLNMPKVGGLEVLRRIRAHESTRMIPVVILTTSREEQDLLKSYQGGCNGYVRKPVVFNDFIEATRQLGMFWLMINEPPPG